MIITRKLKVNWGRADGKPWTEWDCPGGMPLDMLHLKCVDSEAVQVFIGERVMCSMSIPCLVFEFGRAKGYEYIEEWKVRHHLSLAQMSGSQIHRMTELLRDLGHSYSTEPKWRCEIIGRFPKG